MLLLVFVLVGQIAFAETATMRKLKISPSGDGMKIEITLTSSITPTVTVAKDPERIVLDLPAAVANSRQHRVAINRNGVLQVGWRVNSTTPPMTRVIVDLDHEHPYQLTTPGNSIVLMVLPNDVTTDEVRADRHRSASPPAAARGSLWGKFWPQQGVKVPKSTAVPPSDSDLHASFKVKYVAEGAAYLIGGRSSGLAEGMTLLVHEGDPAQADAPNPEGRVVAELRVVSVAATSSVTEIRDPKRDVKPGDWAELAQADYARLGGAPSAKPAAKNSMPASLAVISSPPAQAQQTPRDESRMMARIALDYSGISSSGSTLGRSSSVGLGFQTDMKQIAGTHWDLEGYWRGRFTKNSQPDEETIDDYLDRTYIIQLSYDNPQSPWVAGVGRLYLPWAASLDTIDGGYVGHRFAGSGTAGAFFGSTPNPATWNYRPDQQIAGSFVNFEGGGYDDLHYTSTAGVALSFLKWQLDRPYLFLENALSYSKYFAIYHSLILDSPQGVSTDGITPGAGVSRSYLSLDIQPKKWISFEFFHNYFRDVPTAATALVGTGTVDKLLYQGVNGTLRIEPIKNFLFYTTLGKSDKTGDVKHSLNQMYGFTLKDIYHTGIRVDLHYSKFDSSFARGIYRILSLSRPVGNRMMWNVQGGSQTLRSLFTANQHSFFVDTSLDTNLSAHTFLQGGYSIERGAQLNYSQWRLSLGYRFDSKGLLR
ncbi:MAG: AMIN domain-containing protein [Acidobacteriaceae bacterium]|nr:AMIN domain-containing protein [Acidobacteriaceae bacterium]